MSDLYSKLVEECETNLRSGHAARVHHQLKSLTLSQVPRSYRLRLANLSRRAGLFALGLRLLTPIIHADRQTKMLAPSVQEEAEYAVLLLKSGAVVEAMRRLDKLESKSFPENPLYKAFCHMAKWDYAEAIPELQKYLAQDVSAYAKLIGSVNLAGAFVSEDRMSEAAELLDRLIPLARSDEYHRLLANCLELKTQLCLEMNEEIKAIEMLNEASSLLQSSRTTDQLFILKWRAVLEAKKSGEIAPILRFKKESIERRHWESVREADFQSLRIKFDEDTYQHLLVGTPYEAFRRRLERKLGVASLQTSLILGSPESGTMDLKSGAIDGCHESDVPLRAGKKIHQTISILLQDFYRPIGVGSLFGQMYPDEHYNVLSSPNHVHQMISRTRNWLKKNQIPVTVESIGSAFAIRITGAFAFRVTVNRKRVDRYSAPINMLRELYSGEFKAADARLALGMSEATLRRILEKASTDGILERLGNGRSMRYRFHSVFDKQVG